MNVSCANLGRIKSLCIRGKLPNVWYLKKFFVIFNFSHESDFEPSRLFKIAQNNNDSCGNTGELAVGIPPFSG